MHAFASAPIFLRAEALFLANPVTLNKVETGNNPDTLRNIARRSYDDLAAMIFSISWEYAPLTASSIMGIESFLHHYGLNRSGKISEWGQSTALVTCVWAIVHVGYAKKFAAFAEATVETYPAFLPRTKYLF